MTEKSILVDRPGAELKRDGPDAFAALEHLRHQLEEMQLPHLEHRDRIPLRYPGHGLGLSVLKLFARKDGRFNRCFEKRALQVGLGVNNSCWVRQIAIDVDLGFFGRKKTGVVI